MSHTHIQRRPSTFLVLSPNSSSVQKPVAPTPVQVPTAQETPAASAATDVPSAAVADTQVTPAEPAQQPMEETAKVRRSSSVGSANSTELRFLKLGPIHYGGERGVSDYADI